MKTKPLTTAEAGPFAERLRVLGHPLRLLILDRLQAGGPRPVHRLAGALAGTGETEEEKRKNDGRDRAFPQAALSQHLSQMRRAGLLTARRRGQEVWYAIADPHALTILNCIRARRDRPPNAPVKQLRGHPKLSKTAAPHPVSPAP
ncbi:MAG: metalloregulator ArsR/SmtB family transcription factor [Lentisphaeria bacterium]